MKKLAALTFLAFSSSIALASEVAGTGNATARVTNKQLSIATTSNLNFGTIMSGTGGGHIIISPDNERRVHGKVIVLDTDPFSPASFRVTGRPNETYSILLPKRFELISSGEDPLRISQLRSKSENSGSLGRKRLADAALNASGQDIIHVGARLRIPKHAVPGTYRGELPITVSY